MKYLYETEDKNHSAFASGAVLYSLPGTSAFPIRLISELFQYCYEYLSRNDGRTDKVTIYDPCCGSAYHLAALGFLHPGKIDKIICSDIDRDILPIANNNLNLLSQEGIDNRITGIEAMYAKYGKESHKQALENAHRLKNLLGDNQIATTCHQENIFSETAFTKLKKENIDIVFADIPYENLVSWQGNETGKDEVWLLLDHLLKIIGPKSLVVIASNKKQKVEHDKYSRIKQIKSGKRKSIIMKVVK